MSSYSTSTDGAAAAQASQRTVNPWLIAVTVTLATFMELLDTSIANVSLPHIAGGLGRSFDEVTWVLTTYLVANAVVLPMSAWLSRVFERKNYYLACVAVFTLTSFFCGIAPTLGIMLSARVLQGIGGGGLTPVAQAILVDTFPPAKQASAFALHTIVIVTAPAIGPVLGGWITDSYSWRWIFFINVPIGILAFWLSSSLVKDPPAFAAERNAARNGGKPNIDGIGIGLIALASASLEIALDRGQIDDWFGNTFITWMIVLAVLGWIAAVLWELHVDAPVIDFHMLANRNFAIANILFIVFGFSLWGSTALVPQMLQSLYGYRAIDAGMVVGPGALIITMLAPVTAQMVQRKIVSPRVMVAFSLTIVSASMWYCSTFNLGTDYRHYVLARALLGFGYAFFFVPVNMIAYSELRPDQNNRASSLTNFCRNWGGSFGIAFITTAADRRHEFHQSNLSSSIAISSPQFQQRVGALTSYLEHRGFSAADAAAAAPGYLYQQFQHQVHLLAYMDCLRVIAWVTLAAVPLMLLVRRLHATGKMRADH